MKAMVLAAGLGTRLRPLTDHKPKALVEIGGRTLLEITLTRLKSSGIEEVIVNVHHFAGAILDFLKAKNNFGMRIEISKEDVLLDTGGGLKKAGWFFLEDKEPFLLHNVDVVSTIDFGEMLKRHKENNALCTLAVQERETSRYLLFDEQEQLCGRRIVREKREELVRAVEKPEAWAFTGIHMISPQLLGMMKENGVFSIIDLYLRLAGQEEKIQSFRADKYYWRDLGKLDQVQQAEEDYRQKRFL
ncbi:MAG: nucleotidyltransferase family protein [Candidatus Acidiferrum sp.]